MQRSGLLTVSALFSSHFNVYHKLEQADIVDYLHQHKGEFQTVMAADVFCYFGDLSKIINELTAEKVIFSVETDLQTEE